MGECYADIPGNFNDSGVREFMGRIIDVSFIRWNVRAVYEKSFFEVTEMKTCIYGWDYVVILLVLFLFFCSYSQASDIRVITETAYSKEVNGNAGLELILKATIALSPDIDIKFGVSEGYTAQRATPYALNHAGVRLDIGFLWSLPMDFQVGYTHSQRSWFHGAAPLDVYDYDSVDILCVRKEFNIRF